MEDNKGNRPAANRAAKIIIISFIMIGLLGLGLLYALMESVNSDCENYKGVDQSSFSYPENCKS